jgi:16S rRNA (guanine527-N7)-methyltransferase
LALSEFTELTGSSAGDDHLMLQSLAAELQIALADDQARQLAAYARLLWDWNSRLNLTRHTDWPLFVTRDLLDCVRLAEHIPPNARVLDVGSGGGVPGIVLPILRPDVRVTLCDSVQKKAAALLAIVQAMSLPVAVVAVRAEVLLRGQQFPVVTARAVAGLDKLLTWFAPVWSSIGELLLIKGPRWVDEEGEARRSGLLKRRRIDVVASWPTPGRDHESVLLRITSK